MTSPKKSILIVEDNNEHAYYLEYTLGTSPYQIESCPNGCDALQKCQAQKFDLVIIDINLPDISGEQVATQLKAMPAYKNVPLIAYTANISSSQLIDNLFADLLEKPVLPELVRRKVHNWIK